MDDLQKLALELETDSLERIKIRSNVSNFQGPVSTERSLARTTKVVNRLKKFYAEPNMAGLIDDFRKLDWSPYIVELIDALMDAWRTMKLRDVFVFVEICCHCDCVIPSFGAHLVAALRDQLDNCVNDHLRLRVFLRSMSELVLLHAIPQEEGVSEIISVLGSVILFDSDSTSSGASLIRLQALAFWVGRYGGFIGTEFPISLKAKVATFFKMECPKILKRASEAIASEEARHVQIRIDKGQHLDSETVARYEALKSSLEKASGYMKTVQSVLGFEDQLLKQAESPAAARDEVPTPQTESLMEDEICPEDMQFSDKSEKSFYLDLLDLTARLPSALLEPSSSSPSTTAIVSEFFSRIEASCCSRELADSLALNWFEQGICSKQSKKVLLQLFAEKDVSASQVRFLANIAPFSADLTSQITAELKKRMILTVNNAKIQFRAITTFSELCKFQVSPPGPLLDLLAQCANDLNASSGETASWVLVACGRFLINKPETRIVTENLLSRLMKLKNASTTLPAKVQMALEDAYYQTKPKFVAESSHESLSDIQRYILHLVQVEVYRMQEDELLQLVKRLPWSTDPLVASTMKSGILELTLNVNFAKCDHLASLLAGLVKFKEEFVVDLIDSVFEQFQICLEKDDFRLAPTRVRVAKFIAELYAFRLIDSGVLFDIIFQLVGFRATSSFGAGEFTVLLALLAEADAPWLKKLTIGSILEDNDEEEQQNLVDHQPLMHAAVLDEPPWSFIRIILVATIVTTVAEFFLSGSNRGKMLRFLVVFRRYILVRGKEHLSNKIINVISDMFDALDVRKYDIRNDSIEKINEELAHIKNDLEKRARSSVGGIEFNEDNSFQSVRDHDDDHLKVEPSLESGDEYEHRTDGIDTETADFDREMQAIMVESLSEAKSRKHVVSANGGLNLAIPPSRQTSSQSSENEEAAKFTVLAKSQSGKPVSAGAIVLPREHKLLQRQEEYRIEQETAAKEKEKLKRFIMAYDRDANAPTQPAPRVGHSITLANAVGVRNEDDFDNKLSRGTFAGRHIYRKF